MAAEGALRGEILERDATAASPGKAWPEQGETIQPKGLPSFCLWGDVLALRVAGIFSFPGVDG